MAGCINAQIETPAAPRLASETWDTTSNNRRQSKIITEVAVNRFHFILRAQAASLSDASRMCLLAGRVLIALIAVLLPLMLWTEHLTTWDRFCQGGEDCEMSLLALFAFLCLVILLSHRCAQSAILRLVLQRSLSFAARNLHGASATAACNFFSPAFLSRAIDPASGLLSPPLRI